MSTKYLVTAIIGTLLLTACSAERYEFADYEQLLPRGAIAAITEPEFSGLQQYS